MMLNGVSNARFPPLWLDPYLVFLSFVTFFQGGEETICKSSFL